MTILATVAGLLLASIHELAMAAYTAIVHHMLEAQAVGGLVIIHICGQRVKGDGANKRYNGCTIERAKPALNEERL